MYLFPQRADKKVKKNYVESRYPQVPKERATIIHSTRLSKAPSGCSDRLGQDKSPAKYGKIATFAIIVIELTGRPSTLPSILEGTPDEHSGRTAEENGSPQFAF